MHVWQKTSALQCSTDGVSNDRRGAVSRLSGELNRKHKKRSKHVANDHNVRVSTAANIVSDERPG